MAPTPSTVTTHWYCPASDADMLSMTREPFGSCFLKCRQNTFGEFY